MTPSEEADLGQAMALMSFKAGTAPKRNQGGKGDGARVEIIATLTTPMTTNDIAAAIGRKPDTIRKAMVRLHKEGVIQAEKCPGGYIWKPVLIEAGRAAKS